MPLHSEFPGPGRPPERVRSRSYPGSPPLPKRQHLSPTPPSLNRPFDKIRRTSNPHALTLAPFGTLQSLSLTHEDVTPSADITSKKCGIENWLAKVSKSPPLRTCSCPPRLDDRNPQAASDVDEAQRPLLEVLHEISQSQNPDSDQGPAGSARSSRLTTSHPAYRSILLNNGLYFDRAGAKIPQELQEFLNSKILSKRSESVSPEAIAQAMERVAGAMDGSENQMYDLIGTAILPILRSDMGRGGNTPWQTDGLPRNEAYPTPVSRPKPDAHCGYLTGSSSTWTVKENAVIDHQYARKITQPASGNCFPFIVFELKSEAMGGTIWQAQNQAAGSGACCVSAMRWLFLEAYSSEERSVVDSIAFSACVTQRDVVFSVHYYSSVDNQYYMSMIGQYRPESEVLRCNEVIQNIIEHGLGTRQTNVRSALLRLHPFPAHWK